MGETKVERMGKHAEVLVHQMRADGKGYRKIAAQLEEQFGQEVSHQAVKNYVENSDDRLANLGAKNAKMLQEKKFEHILDVGGQLKKMNDKLEEAADMIQVSQQNKQEVGLLLQIAKELRQHWKFHKEYLEEVAPPEKIEQNFEINQNKTEYRVQMINDLRQLEEEGYITIHKDLSGADDVL